MAEGTQAEVSAPSTGTVRPRHWEWRLVKQKTLTGEILVRRWATDEEPSFTSKQGNGEMQTVRGPARAARGCEKL